MAKQTKITVTLTASNMGDVSEADFNAWTSYVAEHLHEYVTMPKGADVDIEQFSFTNGPENDAVRVSGSSDDIKGSMAGEDLAAAIRDVLGHSLWEAFCADDSAWPQKQAAG